MARWLHQQARRSHRMLIRERKEQLGWWQGPLEAGLAAQSAPERCSADAAAANAIALCCGRCPLLLHGCRGCPHPIRPLLWPPDAQRSYGHGLVLRKPGLPPCPAGDARSLTRVCRRAPAPATSVGLHLQGLPKSPRLSSRLHPTRAPPCCAVRQPLLKKPALRRLAAAQPAGPPPPPPPPTRPQGKRQGAAPQSTPTMSKLKVLRGLSSRADDRRHLAEIMFYMAAIGINLQAPLPYWYIVCFFLIWGLFLVL